MKLIEALEGMTSDLWWSRAEKIIRDSQHLSTDNHYIGGNGAWSVHRRHKTYIQDVIDNLKIPCEGKAAIVGGPPGAGKSKMLPALFDPSEYYVIDPDEIKDWLIDNGLAPQVEGLTPRETGPLLHVESTAIAKKLSVKLAELRANVIWPMTFASPDAVQTRVDFTRKHGYAKVEGAYVLVSLPTSTRRVRKRYEDGMSEYIAGNGLGGKFIDLDNIIRIQGTSIFNSMTHMFDTTTIIDNDMDLV